MGIDTKIEVSLTNEIVWPITDKMAELFQRNKLFQYISKMPLKALRYSRIELLHFSQQFKIKAVTKVSTTSHKEDL